MSKKGAAASSLMETPVGGPDTVYLDHAATSPMHPEVLESMLPYLRGSYGNPSSAHALGKAARAAVQKARESVAILINAHPEEIVFTSGGTESNNLAVLGGVGPCCGRGDRIIVSAVEHASVLESARRLHRERGMDLRPVGVDAMGVLRGEDLEAALVPETKLASVLLANNETGTLQPVGEVVGQCRRQGVLVHCDAVQAAGVLPLDVRALGVDLLTLSAHKFGGPKGVGALFVRKGVRLTPPHSGGNQERGLRPGTENVPAIVGFGRACEIARENLARAGHVAMLRDTLQDILLTALPGARVNGHPEARAPHILNMLLNETDGTTVVMRLDRAGVCVSSGAACASGSPEPSHVLLAMGLSPSEARRGIRFSLGFQTTEAQIYLATDKIISVLNESII